MSSNILKSLLKPKAHLQRNPFDLSNRRIFSAKAGQLLPIQTIHTVPGGHYEIDLKALTRTVPLNTAAYARMKQNFELFYVPIQALWHQWDSFSTQRDNPETSYRKGNTFQPVFNYSALWREIYANYVSGSTEAADDTDFAGYKKCYGSAKLCDLLGYGAMRGHPLRTEYSTEGSPAVTEDLSLMQQMIDQNTDNYLNPWSILAYQKIYYDRFANPYYETPNPLLFNVDDIDCTSFATSTIESGRQSLVQPLLDLFEMRYAQWKKDMFMGVLPDSQFGDVSFVPAASFDLKAVNRPDGSPALQGDQVRVGVDGNIIAIAQGAGTAQQGTKFASQQLVSVLDLRKAEALQKYKETVLRAGFRHYDQMEARFGTRPKHYMDNHAELVAAYDQPIVIDEVMSQAGTESDMLGAIAGKGISATDIPTFKFDAPGEFGVLMLIYYISPESEYASIGVDKVNTFSDPFDYFTPELQNLGLEAVPTELLNGYIPTAAGMEVLGYLNRYYAYKTAIDKVHGEFINGGNLNSWVTPRYDLTGQARDSGFTVRDFHINPQVLKPIFAIDADYSEQTDQFLVNAYFDNKAILPMSVLGLPY